MGAFPVFRLTLDNVLQEMQGIADETAVITYTHLACKTAQVTATVAP